MGVSSASKLFLDQTAGHRHHRKSYDVGDHLCMRAFFYSADESLPDDIRFLPDQAWQYNTHLMPSPQLVVSDVNVRPHVTLTSGLILQRNGGSADRLYELLTGRLICKIALVALMA
jgi:hypothetical protein